MKTQLVHRIDLTKANDAELKRKIKSAADMKPGVAIRFVVDPRRPIPYEAFNYLRAEGGHLGSVQIEGESCSRLDAWDDALNGRNF